MPSGYFCGRVNKRLFEKPTFEFRDLRKRVVWYLQDGRVGVEAGTHFRPPKLMRGGPISEESKQTVPEACENSKTSVLEGSGDFMFLPVAWCGKNMRFAAVA